MYADERRDVPGHGRRATKDLRMMVRELEDWLLRMVERVDSSRVKNKSCDSWIA